MEGLLKVKSSFMGVNRWTNRWVVAQDGILYFKRENDRSEVGRLAIALIDLLPAAPTSERFSFYSGMRLIKVKAKNVEERARWEKVLREMKGPSGPTEIRPESLQDVGSSNIDEVVHRVAMVVTQSHAFELSQELKRIESLKNSLQGILSDPSPLTQQQRMNKSAQIFRDFDSALAKSNRAIAAELTMIKNAHETLSNMCKEKRSSDDSMAMRKLKEPSSPQSIEELTKVKKSFIALSVPELFEVATIDAPFHTKSSYLFKSMNFCSFCSQLTDRSIADLLSKNAAFRKFPISMSQPSVRENLPAMRDPTVKFSVVKLIKDNIGSNMAKVSMPVYINEPLSATQKTLDLLEYIDTIKKAAHCEDQFLRLGYFLALSVLGYSHGIERTKKPFNAILGETYELIGPDYRALSEQVSHHPPITAYHVDSPDFEINGNLLVVVSFSLFGNQVLLKGPHEMLLKTTGERFSLQRPEAAIYNVFSGQLYSWFTSDVVARNLTTGDKATLSFLKKSKNPEKDFLIKGTIEDRFGKPVYSLSGAWNSRIVATNLATGSTHVLGEVHKLPPNSDAQYSFTPFVRNLNNLTPKMAANLPRTDSRFRPDNHAYEYGDIDLAEMEKKRLEETQRARRKRLNDSWKPKWFDIVENGDILQSQFNGCYWKCKESGAWPSDLPDIYN